MTPSITHVSNLAALLPAALPLLRLRLTLRLLEDASLPAYQGAMLRGGFGYAFQRTTCPQACWGVSDQCTLHALCPYRTIFESPRPPDVGRLRNLKDIPRPFVIEPLSDLRTQYAAGTALEFGLVLIGRGIDYLSYFLFGFELLGRMGLGRGQVHARLERAEALRPWQPIGQVIYQDGHMLPDTHELPLMDAEAVAVRAHTLPADLRLTIRTPLRVKARGDYIRTIDLPAILQAICWRLNALTIFYSSQLWQIDHRMLVAQARSVTVEQVHVRWVDWERTSTRGGEPRSMPLGGIVGSAVLRGTSPELRALLLAGSAIHVGKACTFGHGEFRVEDIRESAQDQSK